VPPASGLDGHVRSSVMIAVTAAEACSASYRSGQSRRHLKQFAVQPVGTLCDVDVLTEVGGELDQGNVDAFRPARLAAGRWRG
jgi:hypothetical protein